MPGLAAQDVPSGLAVPQVRQLPDPEHSLSNMIKNFAAEKCKISFSAVSMLFNILEKKKICKKCAK